MKIQLGKGKKIYFASDFHLGAPNASESLEREHRIIRWLDQVSNDAEAIFLVGDIFDFWFEYKRAIPKGFIRFLGKISQLKDAGIKIYFFTGNHDLWMFDYFPKELGIPVYKEPITLEVNKAKFLIGHGDGLGPGDNFYKFLKKIFTSPIAQWLFARLHPNFGIWLATSWSQSSRASNLEKNEDSFKGNDEWLWAYSKEVELNEHHDYYIFGHRHLPLDLQVGDTARYVNLGEWIRFNTYAVFDGDQLSLETFEK
ncbi:UDP-2,3-diacylglucosamine diphosphatase [Penaeicola halotolerans]|uniref:UDP-2,3-diacylglucosamine diphosphatase n=1 Tax=Penaeicola halotolerans TaxID=2793196 RepID=UPI001CF83B9D|nr:UDP-2,3-diacylglucosamine diphosphatase [Penaeicola halotolerans]